MKHNTFRRLHLIKLTVIILCACEALSAAPTSGIFGDHMVLQREMPVPIWGCVKADEKVIVEFAGQRHETISDKKGNWMVRLDPMKADSIGARMTITVGTPPASRETALQDIVIGEVWFCSGQSNMARHLTQAQNSQREIAAANYPLIRFSGYKKWVVSTPEVAGSFSAVAYFFGRELLNELDVPIGLINRSVGGSPIEAWIPQKDLFNLPYAQEMRRQYDSPAARKKWGEYQRQLSVYKEQEKKWKVAREKADNTVKHPACPRKPINIDVYSGETPGSYFRRLVKPAIPYAIRGFLWYQGETNAMLEGGSLAYRDLLPCLIKSWREAWREGPIPFLFVQLPNCRGETWPLMRESMLKCLRVENTDMAVTIDIGDAKDVHPTNKQDVGKRLALLALKNVYHKRIIAESPLFQSMNIVENKAILSFTHVGDGLDLKKKSATGFVIAGKEKQFHPAEVKILDAKTLEVTSPGVKEPVAVRYAWAANPVVTLYNKNGIPASPFRTDMEK